MGCKLCGENKILKESHIIPKFVFRWIKLTGGKYIRKADNPNRRVEDGIKRYLLCNDCEQIFSKWEDKFARQIFYPYANKGIETFKYDGDLLKFSISVLYRLLLFEIEEYKSFKHEHSSSLMKAKNEWQDFLFEGRSLMNFSKVHIFFTSDKLMNNVLPVKRFLNYYARGIDGTIVSDSKTCIVYAKMARIILVGEIIGFNSFGMENTLIELNEGLIYTRKMKLNCQIEEFLIDRVSQINELYDNVSEKQKNIAKEYSRTQLDNPSHSDIANIISRESQSI